MNRNQRRMAAYNARKSSEQIERDAYARKIESAYERLSTGCSLTVSRAINSPSLRSKHESGSACLPEVAQFAAGFRKSKDIVTAR